MSEIYWLTRLDIISTIFKLFAGVVGVVSVGEWGYYLSECIIEDNPNIKQIKKEAIKFTTAAIIFLMGVIFIPNKKDMFLILGIGNTIDYLKENDTARQLPDKCINALDAWADSLIKEKTE